MEVRANYIAVGVFVLIVLFGLAGFAVWLGATSLTREIDRYLIFFTGSVTGIQPGSTVRLRGIPVGQVSDVRLDPANIDRVQVTVDIASGTPIVEGSVAVLEIAGLTGGVYVLISGGRQGNPPIEPAVEGELPVIPSRPSTLEAVFENLPRTLENANQLIEDINAVFSPENVQRFESILVGVDNLTTALGAQDLDAAVLIERINSFVGNADGLTSELRVDLARLSDSLDVALDAITLEASSVSTDFNQLSGSISAAARTADTVLQENREAIREFANLGLPEFTLMVAEIRALAESVTRVINRLERDPAQFIFGDTDQGVRLD